jgi:hypothetical protein
MPPRKARHSESDTARDAFNPDNPGGRDLRRLRPFQGFVEVRIHQVAGQNTGKSQQSVHIKWIGCPGFLAGFDSLLSIPETAVGVHLQAIHLSEELRAGELLDKASRQINRSLWIFRLSNIQVSLEFFS